MKLTGTQIAAILDELRSGFETGSLRPQDHFMWPLEQAIDAYAALNAGHSVKKQVLLFR
jgi:NADPH2:quinone reductase